MVNMEHGVLDVLDPGQGGDKSSLESRRHEPARRTGLSNKKKREREEGVYFAVLGGPMRRTPENEMGL